MGEGFNILSWFDNPEELLVIAGPCSVESEEQLMTTAMALAKLPEVKVLRGGIWKPRTMPMTFEGVGVKAFEWMRKAKETTGLLTMTEVATPQHLEMALSYGIDMVWLGARTVTNPFSVQELADSMRGVEIPVFVKNPVAPDVKLWIGAIERLSSAGIRHIAAIHRGFKDSADTVYRNTPLWHLSVEMHRLMPEVPIITDISHICGRRDLLQITAQKALDIATDGFMIECHCNPDMALTDAEQQITPSRLETLLGKLVIRNKKSSSDESVLESLRERIDMIDNELLSLLSKRMQVSEEIGLFKKEHNVAVLQVDRWNKILNDRINKGMALGLDKHFVTEIFEAIHQESINRQL